MEGAATSSRVRLQEDRVRGHVVGSRGTGRGWEACSPTAPTGTGGRTRYPSTTSCSILCQTLSFHSPPPTRRPYIPLLVALLDSPDDLWTRPMPSASFPSSHPQPLPTWTFCPQTRPYFSLLSPRIEFRLPPDPRVGLGRCRRHT